MGRLMGLDVGLKRIGVALSDEGRRIASPHSVITHKGWGPDIRAIGEIYRANGCEGIVCGLPRNMDGSVGFQAKEVLLFGEQLEQNGYPVAYMDERLSTVEAESALIEDGMRRERRKDYVDKVAAAVILQRYLDWEPDQYIKEKKND